VNSRRARDIPAGVAQPAVPNTGPGGETNIVGGVFVHGFGGGETTNYVGGVGTPEMQKRWTDTSYEVTVRMDDGSYRVVERRDGGQFRPGDRVRMTQGALDRI
jgi:outer membrane lipoprotein SlyB